MGSFKGTIHFIAPENKEKWYSVEEVRSNGEKFRFKIWEKCYRSWEQSSFKTKLLNDGSDLDNLILEYKNKELIELFEDLPLIYKVDYCKYLLLAKRGGGFADMDMMLNFDFRHVLNNKIIYINGSGLTNVQSSLVFSRKDVLWEDLIEECERRVRENYDSILESVKAYSLYKKSLTFKKTVRFKGKRYTSQGIKDFYLGVASHNIGGELMLYCINNYKGDKEIKILNPQYFNKSQSNEFALTTHYCTGLWRRKGRIFGAEGRQALEKFLGVNIFENEKR